MIERQIVQLPLDSIFADYAWNVRAIGNVQASSSDGVYDTTGDGGEQGEGLPGLIHSLRASGQDQPVSVRKVINGKSLSGESTKCPYELVAGFRRYAAFSFLNDDLSSRMEARELGKRIVPNVEDGHIRAIVSEFSAVEARFFNVRENTERAGLKTPDLVMGIRELEKCGMTQAVMAEGLGISKGWVGMLAIVGSLPLPVLAHWREGVPLKGLPIGAWKQLSARDMWKLAKRNRREDLATEEYIKLLTTEPKKKGKGKSGEAHNRKRIFGLARTCGALVRIGVLLPGRLQWSEAIGPKEQGFPLDSGRIEREGVIALWRAAEEGYELGMKEPAETLE